MLNSNQIEVDILVNGKSIAFHKKDGKNYIQAKNGNEYEILVKNNSWSRKLIVSSVDGLDVLTGKKATPDAAGYVLDADRKSTRLNSSHVSESRMPSSA